MFQQLNNFLTVYSTVVEGAVETIISNPLENLSSKLGLLRKPNLGHEPLNGKVCVVTGGNAGIGFATAKLLAQRGAHVILACRSKERGDAAAKKISKAALLHGCNPPSIEVMELDLGSLCGVKDFCQRFNARRLPLHLLVCNAGIMSPPNRLETKDGLEMQFQVNFLSHWLLTHQLVSEQRKRRMRKGSASHSIRHASSPLQLEADARGGASLHPAHKYMLHDDTVRVVVVTSMTHSCGIVNWKDKQSRKSYSPFTSYALSKLANVLCAKEFQRRFDRNRDVYGIDTAVAVHPGIVNTELAREVFKQESKALMPLLPAAWVSSLVDCSSSIFMRTPANSAHVILHSALAPASEVAGQYMASWRVSRPDKQATDPKLAEELWDHACELTGITTDRSLA